MGKAVGLLPSWYWPDGVQRYVAAPPVSIFDLAAGRWARRYGDDAALITPSGTTTFRELDERCARVAGALAARFPDRSPRLAIAVEDGDDFAALFLGALRAGLPALLLAGADPEATAEFAPDLVVSTLPGVDGVRPEALLEADAPPPGRPARVDAHGPAIALPSEEGLAWHSHVSLMSAAMAFVAFTGVEEGRRLLALRPPGSWEGLISLLGPLQAGSPALLTASDDENAARAIIERERPAVLWLDAARAEGLPGSPLGAAIRGCRPNVYVTSNRPFPRHLRRRLRHELRAHVLTAYGYPECGVIAADHVSWYLEESSGIAMVGVDILALNPATGQPSELPWQVLSHARIGARTQAVATNRRTAPADEEKPEGSWYTTPDDGIVDGNGMLYLLGR